MTDLTVFKPADSRPVCTKRSHRKVKSGCRTCKVRKVKCDEGWPACRACVSTGRVCDGYGIWGGGGNRYEQRRTGSVAPKPAKANRCHESVNLLFQVIPFPPLIPLSNTEEHLHFQFFREKTLAKLPGLYSQKYSNIWESLVIQACAEEPAVMHAVLAISSAHRRKVFDGASRNKVLVLPDKQEEFLLRNYCKSIQYLQPRFHTCGEHSMRTTLITCLVFTYLELLRGTYKRAYDHLDGGLKILADLKAETGKKKTWLKPPSMQTLLNSNQGCTDAFLTEAFARLRVQMEFSGLRSGTKFTLTPKPSLDLPTLKFGTFHEARHYLDRIFDSINVLSQAIRDGTYTSWPDGYWNMMLTERRFMQGSLDMWSRSYVATKADLIDTRNDDELTGYEMLHIYHNMAEIMGATCLSPEQAVFDQHTSGFLSIVTQCNNIASNGEPSRYACSRSRRPETYRRSWPDISWIPPLYYTAIKCRNRHIRTRAVGLMSSFWHYEIVWDLRILKSSSIVAKEVIRLEEGDFFEVNIQGSDLKMTSNEDAKYKLNPSPLILPEERRFDTVEMILLDGVPGGIQIVCRKWCKNQPRIVREVYVETQGAWAKIERDPTATSDVRKRSPLTTKTIAHRI